MPNEHGFSSKKKGKKEKKRKGRKNGGKPVIGRLDTIDDYNMSGLGDSPNPT